jgi:hypothetical protein
MRSQSCACGCGVQIGPDDLAFEVAPGSYQGAGGQAERLPDTGGGPSFFLPGCWADHRHDADPQMGPLWQFVAGPKPLRELPGYL